MDWSEWYPIYQGIVRRLGLDEAADRQATLTLTRLLMPVDPSPLLDKLRGIIENRTVVVFGAGPSLERHVQTIKSDGGYDDLVYVAADGVVDLLLRELGRCDVLVTDLDGLRRELTHYDEQGIMSIVHGHGDNITRLETMVPNVSLILGSTQTRPTTRTFLWGGFTDGDRACYLVAHYNPARVILAGMDFGNIVGRWSKPTYTCDQPANFRKSTKLAIGTELLAKLIADTTISFTRLG